MLYPSVFCKVINMNVSHNIKQLSLHIILTCTLTRTGGRNFKYKKLTK